MFSIPCTELSVPAEVRHMPRLRSNISESSWNRIASMVEEAASHMIDDTARTDSHHEGGFALEGPRGLTKGTQRKKCRHAFKAILRVSWVSRPNLGNVRMNIERTQAKLAAEASNSGVMGFHDIRAAESPRTRIAKSHFMNPPSHAS